MKRKQITVTIIVVFIVAVFSLCTVNALQKSHGTSSSPGASGAPSGRATGKRGANAQSEEATTVRAAAAAVKTLKPYIDENGDVEANVDVAIYPDIGGRIVNFNVAIGDSVSKGQTIARIDPSKPGSSYGISPVIAPITGTVTDIKVDQGATVTTSTAIASVGIISDLKIVVNLAERDSAKAQKGMGAIATFEALPNESFPAVVTRVSPVLNATSRSREITFGFVKHDPRISAGMYAKVRLYTTPISGKIVVPVAAVVTQNNETCVFVASDKDGKTKAEKRVVKTGTTVDNDIAITEGISTGDKVIYEGQSGLSDGASVTILAEGSK